MRRLFTGIEIPEPIQELLGDLEAPLPGAKWVEMDDLHMTLRFAGEIDGRMAEDFADLLAGISIDPFPLRLKGLGVLGGRDPRVLYADIEPSEPLERLQRAHERAARGAGLPPDPRRFQPHVTLARLKNARPEALARYLQHNGRFAAPAFTVTRFVLFSAKTGGGGPYVVEAEFPLAGWHGEVEDWDGRNA